jgi:hypothetical protein
MATNLFEIFDGALGSPRPSLLVRMRLRLDRFRGERAAARRRARLKRAAHELPPHLLRDIGLVRWDNRLWRAYDDGFLAPPVPASGPDPGPDGP